MTWRLITADVLEGLAQLEDESVQCVVTSPPYWGLRDYGVPGQLGLEKTPEEYVERMVEAFREVRRVLRKDGTLWLNMGDCYAASGAGARDPERWPKQSRNDHRVEHSRKHSGLKPKDLVGMPWRLAFALQADGWWLRCDIIWSKPNPMPESVTDRPTKAHEYVFLMSKSARYYYDADAVREPHLEASIERASRPWQGEAVRGHPTGRSQLTSGGREEGAPMNTCHPRGRNKRSVWSIATQPYPEAHFATFPEKLVEPCVKAGCPEGGVVLDPFCGSGTAGAVSVKLGRSFVGIELNPEYVNLARKRIGQAAPLFAKEEK